LKNPSPNNEPEPLDRPSKTPRKLYSYGYFLRIIKVVP